MQIQAIHNTDSIAKPVSNGIAASVSNSSAAEQFCTGLFDQDIANICGKDLSLFSAFSNNGMPKPSANNADVHEPASQQRYKQSTVSKQLATESVTWNVFAKLSAFIAMLVPPYPSREDQAIERADKEKAKLIQLHYGPRPASARNRFGPQVPIAAKP